MDFTLHAPVLIPSVDGAIDQCSHAPAKRQKVQSRSVYPFDSRLPARSPASRMLAHIDQLPIDSSKNEILDLIRNADITILTSDTGSGKSSRVPQFVLDEQQGLRKQCRIVVTEPRRVAARELARRVAAERGERLVESGGGSVGYAVREDAIVPCSWNSIVYVTEDKLVNVLEQGYFTHIFIDEAHERRIGQDTLLMLCKQLIARCKSSRPTARPDGRCTEASLKVILMTASIVSGKLVEFFETPISFGLFLQEMSVVKRLLAADYVPVVSKLHISGRQHEIMRLFLNDTNLAHSEYDEPSMSIVSAVRWLYSWYGEGDVLVFVAGVDEIRSCIRVMEANEHCMVCPLYAGCSGEEKQRALEPSWTGSPKVIVATNVAETSLTIDGIKFIINYGCEKNPPELRKEFASRASQLQREGRAGRVQDGICIHMMTELTYQSLPEFRTPEMQRLPLHSLVLVSLSRGYINNASEFQKFASELPSPPEVESLARCIADLENLDVIHEGVLTVLGAKVAALPLDIPVGIALITAVFLGVGEAAALVLAAADSFDFLMDFLKEPNAREYCELPWGSGKIYESDVFAAASFLEWHLWGKAAWTGDQRTLRNVIDKYHELRRIANELGPSREPVWLEQVWPHVEFSFCAGYRLNIAVCSKKRTCYKVDGTGMKTSNKSLVTATEGTCLLYIAEKCNIMNCLHPASPISILTFAGKNATCENGLWDTGIVLDDVVHVSYPGEICEEVLGLRRTFVILISGFLDTRSSSSSSSNAPQQFQRFLSYNTGTLRCTFLHEWTRWDSSTPAHSTKQVRARQKSRSMLSEARVDMAPLHLASRERCSLELPPVSAIVQCRTAGEHRVSKNRKGRPEYTYFQAASEGCLACVRKELELVKNVPPEVLSESQQYSVRDFAAWSEKQHVSGASEVCAYLDEFWAHLPLQS